MSDRLPADAVLWSAEAEQSVLACALLDNRAIADLRAEQFFDGRHRQMWSAITELLAANKPADPVTVAEAMRDKGQGDAETLRYLEALRECIPGTRALSRYAEIVRDKHAQRALLVAVAEAREIAEGQGAAGEKIAAIVQTLSGLQRQSARRVPRSIAEIALQRTGHYEALQSGTETPGIPTHLPALDRWLNGGLRPGYVYVLAARPSVGKSSFSAQIALNVARDGHGVLFLSQEMPDGEVADRVVSNIGRVDYSALLTGQMEAEHWTRAAEALDVLGRLPLHVDDQPGLTLLDVRMKLQQTAGVKVVVLDYIQLMSGGSRRSDANRNAEIEEISRGLKALAKDFGVAMVLLSQLNRQVESRANRRPTLADLRDSGAIEQDADVVMFLWPVRDLEGEGRKIVGLCLGKNRQGRLGEIGLDFFGAHQRWAESTADISPPKLERRSRGGFGYDD